MFLLRKKAKHFETITIVKDYEMAKKDAREFVGDHHALDGCSTPRAESEYTYGKFVASRSTSFGRREAWVYSATTPNGVVFDLTGA